MSSSEFEVDVVFKSKPCVEGMLSVEDAAIPSADEVATAEAAEKDIGVDVGRDVGSKGVVNLGPIVVETGGFEAGKEKLIELLDADEDAAGVAIGTEVNEKLVADPAEPADELGKLNEVGAAGADVAPKLKGVLAAEEGKLNAGVKLELLDPPRENKGLLEVAGVPKLKLGFDDAAEPKPKVVELAEMLEGLKANVVD